MSKANGPPSKQGERSSLVHLFFRTRSSLFLLVVSFFLLSLSVFSAPSFLLVSDPPVKSDAVIFFIGGKNDTALREREAHQLIREGFADYLITPASGQIMKRAPNGKLERITLASSLNPSNLKVETASRLENTHIEVLEAKRIMENLGLRSALLVSSPYHMRRIKLISGKVFNDGQAVRYIPTRYESPGEGFWLFKSSEGKLIPCEYAKIVWFLVYSTFSLLFP